MKIRVGWQGDYYDIRASYSPKLGIWWYHNIVRGKRYWNIFGAGEPEKYPYSNSIVCEINFPLKGIQRRVAGLLGENESGEIFVAHSGRIGGGRKGIRRESFWREFGGLSAQAKQGDIVSDFALVSSLGAPRFPQQVEYFVHEVQRIKRTMSRPDYKEKTPPKLHGFTKEFFGHKQYKVAGRTVQEDCDHGIIVNKLAEILESRRLTVYRTDAMDLCVAKKSGYLCTLFEVKTDADTTSCYQALGQLYFNGSLLPKKPRYVAVFPKELMKAARTVLRNLGIDCILYSWNSDQEPVFDKSLESFA